VLYVLALGNIAWCLGALKLAAGQVIPLVNERCNSCNSCNTERTAVGICNDLVPALVCVSGGAAAFPASG